VNLDSPPPRTLIDATAIPPERGGVGRYVDGLLAAFADASADVAVLCRPGDADHYRRAGLRGIVAPGWVSITPLRLLWEQLAIPGLVRRGGFSVLHSPHYTFPVFGKFGRVVTVHDLTFFTLPGAHSVVKRWFFRFWLGRLARAAFPVVAVSRATADELTRILRVDPSRVVVAPHGYDAATFSPPSSARISSFAAGLEPPTDRWIAFLGTLEPRKNLVALVAAHRLLGPRAPALLLAGGAGWDSRLDAAVAESTAAGHDVRLLGYLPVDDLAPFLAGAEIVAYPSLGEGFGLPVLEAMATGACVLTTRLLALPEVGGDAVAYAEPAAEALADEMAALLGNGELRADLRRRATVRAATFTWEASALAHLRAYGRAT
jgi:glycosyltransferase involved in cell wall biosynthesis